MSDRATMLQETVEAYADLHTILDGLTEEQVSRIRLGVLGARGLALCWPGRLRECSGQMSEAAERLPKAQGTYDLGAGLFLGTEISGRSERWLISAAPVERTHGRAARNVSLSAGSVRSTRGR
jgi:hypothetical protein